MYYMTNVKKCYKMAIESDSTNFFKYVFYKICIKSYYNNLIIVIYKFHNLLIVKCLF